MEPFMNANQHVFTTRNAGLRFVLATLTGKEEQPKGELGEVQAALAQWFTDQAKRPIPGDVDDELGFSARLFNYIITKEDLDLMGVFKDALLAAASSDFIFSDMEASALVSVFLAVAQLYRNIKNKGFILEPIDLHVLLTLRAAKARLTTQQLCQHINSLHITGHGVWEPAQVQEVLNRLTKIGTPDGSVTELVKQDGEQRWGVAAF